MTASLCTPCPQIHPQLQLVVERPRKATALSDHAHSMYASTTASWVVWTRRISSVNTTMYGQKAESFICKQYLQTVVLSSAFSLYFRYIFWFMVECCASNTFVLLKHYQPTSGSTLRQLTYKSFRLQLAQGLIGNYNSRQRYALPTAVRAKAISGSGVQRFHARVPAPSQHQLHFPVKGTKGRCSFCWNYRGNRRHDSCVRCRQCGKALCLEDRDSGQGVIDGPSCFERYHATL